MWRSLTVGLLVVATPSICWAQASHCVELFSKAKFEGRSLRLCDDTDSLDTKGWSSVGSLKVQGGVWALVGDKRETLVQPGDHAGVGFEGLKAVRLTTQKVSARSKAGARKRGPSASLVQGRASLYRLTSVRTSSHLSVSSKRDAAPALTRQKGQVWDIVPGAWAKEIMLKHHRTAMCVGRDGDKLILQRCVKRATLRWRIRPKPAHDTFVQIMTTDAKRCLTAQADKTTLELAACDSKTTRQRFLLKEVAGRPAPGNVSGR